MLQLSAFHGQEELKNNCVEEFTAWVQQRESKSIFDTAAEICSLIKTYTPSDFAFENYDSYPEVLGLPIWLSNLLRTINHHIPEDSFSFKDDYRKTFYPKLIDALKIGIDYSNLFHKWELSLLQDLILKEEEWSTYILRIIHLHEEKIKGNQIKEMSWHSVMNELDNIYKTIDEFTGVPNTVGLNELDALEKYQAAKSQGGNTTNELWKDLGQKRLIRKAHNNALRNPVRAAFLSASEYISPNTAYTSSAEAFVDTMWDNQIINTGTGDHKDEAVFRMEKWNLINDRLIKAITDWK